jgi:hypothetical protein
VRKEVATVTSATGSLSLAQLTSTISAISLTGRIDRSTAMRVLRLVDARIRMAELGQVRTRHLLLDLTRVERLVPGSGPLLRSAALAAAAASITLCRVGRPREGMGLVEQQAVSGMRYFPDVDSALAGLG